jgi:serine/threonine-protein kinase
MPADPKETAPEAPRGSSEPTVDTGAVEIEERELQESAPPPPRAPAGSAPSLSVPAAPAPSASTRAASPPSASAVPTAPSTRARAVASVGPISAPRVSSTPPPIASGGPLRDDDDPLVGSTLLERVRIVRPIARGGMGKVYYGEQVRMKRPCAIKILDPRLAGDADTAEFARRFLLEASTAAKLTHPNVVTIFDYGETDDGNCFIAMEYLEGRSLSDELKRSGRIPPERAIHIAKQVCRALREAHALGVVHRDMKPGNVFLVKQDDDDDFAKVLDFGLVKETSSGEGQDYTQIGQIMGSPRYMAPEQVQGKPVDARTDIYSLGVMLYAMLAGKPPFDKATELATMMAQVSDPPPPLASVAPDVALPPGLDAVVMKCLAKKPDDRFASMEELVTALKLRPGMMTTSSDSGGQPAPPLAASTGVLVQAPAKRGAMSVVLVVAAVLGVGLTALLLMREASPPPVASPMAAAPPPASPLPPPPASTVAAPPKPKVTLHVETDPPGAKVKEEGDLVCEATPCDIVYTGEQADPTYEHLLTFLKSDYKLERKLVKVSASPFSVKLTRAR